MLSYRHAFHAGNFADVLKHSVLIALIRYLQQKEKGFSIIDTHAGAGRYALDSGYATKIAEYRLGVERLLAKSDTLPALLKEYVDEIRAFNRARALVSYPGSPAISASHLRPQDKLHCFELHREDVRLLKACLGEDAKNIYVSPLDGFSGLKALLPPPARRALILIDPPYEEKQEYMRVFSAVQDALKRFAQGVYVVWYPELTRLDAQELPVRLKRLPAKNWLNVVFRARAPAADGVGMHGSGLFIMNPPWVLAGALREALPVLVERLGQDSGARFLIETSDA